MTVKVAFLGSKPFGLAVLRAVYRLRPNSISLVITFDDRDDTRSAFNEFYDFCSEFDLPLHIAANRGDVETVLLKLKPELCLVVGWYWLLSQNLIDSMRLGAVGIHNSLLPKYRGGSPLVWTLLNGETECGCSLFSLGNEMDAGNIWLQCFVTLVEDDDINSAQQKIETALLIKLDLEWCSLLDGKLQSYPQNHNEATYCAQRLPGDGQIEWNQSSVKIYNSIRAQISPYPGAFTTLNGRHIVLLSAELFPYCYFGSPGQVSRVIPEQGALVVCGDSQAILVKRLLVDGTVRCAAEIFNSIKMRLGH